MGILILVDTNLWGISFHAVVVFSLGKKLLFKSVLGRCGKSLYCQPPLNRGQPLILGQTNKGQDISEEFFLPSIPQKYQRINFTTFCPSLKKVVESKAVY